MSEQTKCPFCGEICSVTDQEKNDVIKKIVDCPNCGLRVVK